jgi:hypothetical protein
LGRLKHQESDDVSIFLMLERGFRIGDFEMTFLTNSFGFDTQQWFILILAAVLIGMSKTSISGFHMPVIPALAFIFGGMESTGIVLPLLIVGDLFAVFFYKRHAQWNDVAKLLPWTFAGLIAGVVTGRYINDAMFKSIISVIVIFCLLVLVYNERKDGDLYLPKGKWFTILAGATSGFASMIGNAAGPIFAIYLLSMNMKKNRYLGTTAYFFLIVNVSKVPLQIIFWSNIRSDNLSLTLVLIPAIAFGAFIGLVLIKRLSEKPFRKIIVAMTAITAIRLLM